MIDFIVPKKVDLIKSKEMHGHVILDIHNTRSGFTERIEKHNTVTTAANEFMWLNYLAYLRSGGGYRPSSLYDGVLGGVCLFTDTISGGTMLPLGNNHLVGYAGTSTTLSGNRGVFNESESSFNVTSGTATSVWDWGTSQANGTIGSVARTSAPAGNGYFDPYSHAGASIATFSPQDLVHTSSTYMYVVIGFDKANGIAYLYNGGYYYSYPYTEAMSVQSGTMSALYVPYNSSALTQICATSATDSSADRWYDVENQAIYSVAVTTSGTTSDGVITIYSVDLTATTPEETATSVTMAGCYLIAGTGYNAISDGYIYISGYDPDDTTAYGVYQMKISDNSINFFGTDSAVTAQGYTVKQYPISLIRWGTGGVGCSVQAGTSSGTTYVELLLEQDGTIIAGEPEFATSAYYYKYRSLGVGAGADVPVVSLALTRYYLSSTVDGQYGIKTAYDFLGTYCNLDTAITKTSSETLKLTYTLSDS